MDQNTTKIYKEFGGDEMVVADGGVVTVQDGATITIEDGATLLVDPGAEMTVARRPIITTTEATMALEEAQNGAVIRGTATTGTQVFTLPSAATEGLEFTFVAGHADSEININPGAETILGLSISVATNKDLKNTAASNAVGDSVTIVSDGTRWLITNIQGTWAST